MSTEFINFLTTKFTTAFQEAEKGQTDFPSRKIFQEIDSVLKMKVSSSIPSVTRDTLMTCLYTLNDAISDCRMLSEARRRRALPRYTLAELYQLRKIKNRLLKVREDLQDVANASISRSATSVGGRADGQQIPEMPLKVYGFDKIKEDVVTSLRKKSDNGLNTLGIVGMGGVGKTTLCQLVYNHDTVKREFIPRIWVTLPNITESGSDSTKSIAEYILKELGEEEEDRTNSTASPDDLLVRLHKHLSGKKYLIVFDDAWDIASWYKKLVDTEDDESGKPRGLPKGYGGGIIVTSRLEEDVKEMLGEANLQLVLPTLDGEDCWSIFMDELNMRTGSGVHPQVFEGMKSEIVENCNGLPSAAKSLGEILFTKHIILLTS